ncbi:hypothetical protein V8E52_011050 [Russula decolorans]
MLTRDSSRSVYIREMIFTGIRYAKSRYALPGPRHVPLCSHKYVTSFVSSLIKGSATEHSTTKEVLNSPRVLQRVLPVIIELGSEPRVLGGGSWGRGMSSRGRFIVDSALPRKSVAL